MGKVEIDVYFCVTADILTKVLLKRFWSSPLPTIWILSKSLVLMGGHGHRKNKFSREKKTFIFLACNIYSILAEYSRHSCRCTFRWALWPMGLWSHYKSMEILSCQSNKRTWAMAIKNIIYVEANVMNLYAKFQLHPPYGFWGEDFWIVFRKFTLYAAI